MSVKKFDDLPEHTKKLLSEMDEATAQEWGEMDARHLAAAREFADLVASGKTLGRFVVWVFAAIAGGAATVWAFMETLTKIASWKGLK